MHDIIYSSTNKHTETLILLHTYNQEIEDVVKIVRNIQEVRKNLKIVVPICSKINVKWPDGRKETCISWYNYFTEYNGFLKHDIIDLISFYRSVNRIIDLIKHEAIILGKYNKITLCGMSQGGTVAIHAALTLEKRINQVICIDTIFMHSYFDYSKFNIIQYFEVFQSNNDFIYSPMFQDYCYYELIKYGNFVNTEKYDTTHTECFDFISKFIIKKLQKNIKFKDTGDKNNEHNDGAKRLRI